MIYTVENTVGIGKPVAVFVNGNRIKWATHADTDKGEVIFIPHPARPMKGKRRNEVYTRKLRGTVTVEPIK